MSETDFVYHIHKNTDEAKFAIIVDTLQSGCYVLEGAIDKLYSKLRTLGKGNVVTRAHFDYYDQGEYELPKGYTVADSGRMTAKDVMEVIPEGTWTTHTQLNSPSIMRRVVARARDILFTDRWWNGEV